MGKAKRSRKEEMETLQKWFKEFSVACPWRMTPPKEDAFCIPTHIPKTKHAMVCMAINCAPLFLANRLIQMTFGERIYQDDKLDTPRKH
ncbi:MAG TPA: hypothetical protein ENI27_02270 [bacterium]|nr:hypothetical protein [bacterium]